MKKTNKALVLSIVTTVGAALTFFDDVLNLLTKEDKDVIIQKEPCIIISGECISREEWEKRMR